MISVRRFAFLRWLDAWSVSRTDLEVVIVPTLGRIMRFARPGGANALWINPTADKCAVDDWINWGGEKIWFWPQSDWPARQGRAWPPPEPQGSATAVEILPDGLRWGLAPVHGYPFSVTRTLTVDPAPGSPMRVTTQTAPGEHQLWSVTQIDRPAQVHGRGLRLHSDTPAWRRFDDATVAAAPIYNADKNQWVFACQSSADTKIGLDADQLSATTPAGQLTITSVSEPTERARHAVGEAAQIYCASDQSVMRPIDFPPYAELEFLAPPQSTQFTQVWQLL